MKKLNGNAVIGQSGGPTAAINATLAGVIMGCMDGGIEKIYGMKNGIEGLLSEDLIDLRRYFSDSSDKALTLLSHTPAAALGSCRKKLKDDETAEALYEIFEKYDISYFFYIGGNDSMDAVARLTAYAASHPEKREMRFIGVPKTIDNDLVLTDHTPGFGSAAKYIAASMQEIMRDCAVYKTPAVTIVEIMGRDAGWLTTAAGLTKALTGTGPELIYLPERDFCNEKFIDDINRAFSDGKGPYIVIAVSEGLRTADGKYVGESAMSGAVDSFGHKYLSGTGKYLENLVREKIGCKVRSVEVNILQRCAGHIVSAADISDSVKIGRGAVEIALSGESGKMAAYVRKSDADGKCFFDIESGDVTLIANRIKKVPDDYINDTANGITDECVKYLKPLILGECDIIYENGLPKHFSF